MLLGGCGKGALEDTLIKKIEIFNSVKGEDGKKHVPITIHFRSVDIVTVPDEEEIIATMEEIRNNPTKVAKNKGKRCNPNGLHRILHRTVL